MSSVYKNDYRAYFYRDLDIPNFIFVSLKPNLNDKSVYPNYNLEKVYLSKWYEDGYKKQFIFYTDLKKKSIENKIKANRNENIDIRQYKNFSRQREHILNRDSFIQGEIPEYIFITSNKH
jgi:hypothetical protein